MMYLYDYLFLFINNLSSALLHIITRSIEEEGLLMEKCRQRPRLNEELKRKNERPEAFRKEEFKKEAES
jgi:hypothetical protein